MLPKDSAWRRRVRGPRPRPPPVAHLGGLVQHREMRGSAPNNLRRNSTGSAPAEHRELVERAVHGEAGVGMAHRAPPQTRAPCRCPRGCPQHVRECRTACRRRPRRSTDRTRALGNEGVGTAAAQTPWLTMHCCQATGVAVAVDCRAHARNHVRPVRQTAARRLRASVSRSAPACRRPSKLRGLDHHLGVALRAPPEAAAEKCRVHLHLGGIEAQHFGDRIAIGRLHLRAQLQVAAVGAHIGEAVERLHRANARDKAARIPRPCVSPRRTQRAFTLPRVRATAPGPGRAAAGIPRAARWSRDCVRSFVPLQASASRPRLAAQVFLP